MDSPKGGRPTGRKLREKTDVEGKVVRPAKNQPTRRRPVKVAIAIPDGAQAAAARRSAEAQLRTLIAEFAPTELRLIGSMRRRLRKRLPTAYEVVYEYRDAFVISYSPNGRGYDGVLAIRASADGVKLYFNRGKELPDPEKLLRGSGAQVRFIDVKTASTLTQPAVATLVEEAIACNRTPFAHAGHGPMIVRSTSAKQRRRGTV